MKKTILSLFLLLSGILTIDADNISLGYCDGGTAERTLDGTSQVAALFPANEFPMYQGATIIGVRIGVASDVANGTKIFIRSKIDGKNIMTFNSTSLYQGWNDVYFDNSMTYSAEDLYVGFETPSGVTPCVSGDVTPNSCFVFTNGKWQDRAAQNYRPICIELLIDGDNYTHADGALLSVDSLSVGINKPFAFTGLIRNNTNQTLSSARMSYDLGNGAQEADAVVADVLPGETGTFSLPIDGVDKIGLYKAKIQLVAVGGVADEYAFNNTVVSPLNVVREIVERNVLLEVFTGQGCVNCPGAHERLAEALKDETNYVEVAHHYGFGSDDFTAPGSSELTWFFNDGSTTFAPGLMIDRHYWGEDLGLSTSGNKPSPVFVTPASDFIKAMLHDRLAKSSPVSLDVKRNYDSATRELTIQVGMKKIEGMSLGTNPVLNIDLIENGLHGSQTGSTGKNYEHNNVNRLFVTDEKGESVSLSDEDYTYATYKVTVDKNWNSKNMKIVAFVSNYDKSTPNNCDVYNAASVSLEGHDDITSAIASVKESANDATVKAIYNANGMRLTHKQPGLNILLFNDGTVRKVYE